MSQSMKKTRYISTAAFIAALYVMLTYLTNMFGLASGVIQIRLSEILCILPYFTPAAIPGLAVGCLLASILTGCCGLDIIFGTLATLIGAGIARMIRRAKYLVPLPTILSNALIVPFVLMYGYGLNLPYWYMFATVGLGELISCGILGTIFMKALSRISYFNTLDKE